MRGGRRRGVQGGYALLMVMAALTVVAFVALRFAERMDQLRQSAAGFNDYAEARARAAGARAAGLYFLATRPLRPAGRGEGEQVLREDGRLYRFPDQSLIAVQDYRGLLAINAVDRRLIQALLVQDGLDPIKAQAWIDVLDDYIDTDSLKRLNGAEKDEYRQQELTPPRNDWLLSLRELSRMPLWKDDPERLARVSRHFHAGLINLINPNTATDAVIDAMFVNAPISQRQILTTLRRTDLLTDGRTATRLTGLPLDVDEYIFLPGNDMRLTVWSPGLPRSLEYNARLTPAGLSGPWILVEQQPTTRLNRTDEANAAPLFPMASLAGQVSRPLGSAAP